MFNLQFELNSKSNENWSIIASKISQSNRDVKLRFLNLQGQKYTYDLQMAAIKSKLGTPISTTCCSYTIFL
jgi:hypothetical protein